MSPPTDAALDAAAKRLASILLDQQLKLVCAESCSGGWVAKVCTDRAGSSAWFAHGLVAYSNPAKTDLLGVQPEVLEQHGAVSAETAQAMAIGACGNQPGRVALAVTGIAGPSGATQEKPVGLVWFGWALANGEVAVESARFQGDRDAVRRASVLMALAGLVQRL